MADLTIEPGFVRILAAKARQALVPMPDEEDDDVMSEVEIDPASTVRRGHADRLEEEREPNLTPEEVSELIEDLNEDEQADLVALVWIGRGDFDADGFEEARTLAKERREEPTSDYLLAMPLLPSFLETGLEAVTEPGARTTGEV